MTVDAERPDDADRSVELDPIDPGPIAVDPIEAAVADEEPPPTRLESWRRRLSTIHPAAWLTLLGAIIFSVVFGRLGIQHHRNFGTWSYDMGIYDQGFWLVSRGGQSFVTVRGLEFWGHHLNVIVIAFVPFYWLGAGPSFLYVAQATALGFGAIPVYLIARDKLANHWAGLVIAGVYLMYAPIQWISWANFHPEALVVTPFLFAWWFATQRRWRAFFIAVLIALSTREDTALAVIMLGLVLLVVYSRGDEHRYDRRMALATMLVGAGWYVASTRVVIPHFNRGMQPFYVQYFYGNYGETIPEIIGNIVRHPSRVWNDATEVDRLRFYRDLGLPWGGLPLAGPLHLLMAAPQMLASVIGLSPYARMIRYQYTSVMIAPIVIAAIEGAALVWRVHVLRRVVLAWLVVCAFYTNVWWSPSPISDNEAVWAKPSPRHDAMREALRLIPDGASVTATYNLLPHLSHREQVYDWPNPWVPAYWGNDDTYRLPDPATIDYIAVDRNQVGTGQRLLFEELIGHNGSYEVLLDRDDVVVARRRDP